jgi:hypothetical protein
MQEEIHEPLVRSTVVEGMMIGGYSEGTEIQVSDEVTAECVNGEVWRVLTDEEELLGYINPRCLATGRDVVQELEKMTKRDSATRGYSD